MNKAQDDNCNVEKSKHKSSKVQKTITGLFQTTLVLEASELAASSNFRNTKYACCKHVSHRTYDEYNPYNNISTENCLHNIDSELITGKKTQIIKNKKSNTTFEQQKLIS